MYWIGAIGPHWQYGEKIDDSQMVCELSGWHDTIHDFVSFNDLQDVVQLVAALCEFAHVHPGWHFADHLQNHICKYVLYDCLLFEPALSLA